MHRKRSPDGNENIMLLIIIIIFSSTKPIRFQQIQSFLNILILFLFS
ncbi:Hypothetical protein ABZS17G119_03004 [Kosakonia cowanii]